MSAEDAISQIHSWKLYRLKWPGSPKEKVQRKERKWAEGRGRICKLRNLKKYISTFKKWAIPTCASLDTIF